MTITAPAVTRDQEQFYKALFNDAKDFIEIRLISESKPKPQQIFLTFKELLHYSAPLDSNVYIGIFGRSKKGSGKSENCSKTNAIYLDFDGMELEEINFRIDMAGLPQPSMIVNSGHGYHVYWLLEKAAGHEVQPIIKAMQALLNADPKAVDPARILRVPDTMNVKADPIKCELIELNDRRTALETFESILKVKAQAEIIEHIEGIPELLEIRFNGLNNMAAGVQKGERNFCTGRIVQTLKRLNYTKHEASEIIFRWNTLNRPKKPVNELKKEINVFWHESQYKYDGKTFSDEGLQELNERFIDNETAFFKGGEDSNFHYDNDLLGDQFYKISGLVFAVLAIVKLSEEKGITLKEIAHLCRRTVEDKTLLKSVDHLVKNNHVSKKTKKGLPAIYHFKEKAFSEKRGFTSTPKLLHKLYIEACNARQLEKELNRRPADRLNETRYKMLILLESYAFDSKRELFASDSTLANRMRLTNKSIKNNLQWLVDNQYIKFAEKQGRRYIRLIYS